MRRNRIFSTSQFKDIAERTKDFLNTREEFLSRNTSGSPRAVGDAIEEVLGDHFEQIVGPDCAEYSAGFARRAMADLAFRDSDGFYYVVDVKTHREDTKFNMPNLTSVERLARFYEDETNYFVLLLVKYRMEELRVLVSQVTFVPIEFLSWDCLTIGALGWGQIQIANSNRVQIDADCSRRRWMLELCDIMLEFYPREISKIRERCDYFERVRQGWLSRGD